MLDNSRLRASVEAGVPSEQIRGARAEPEVLASLVGFFLGGCSGHVLVGVYLYVQVSTIATKKFAWMYKTATVTELIAFLFLFCEQARQNGAEELPVHGRGGAVACGLCKSNGRD